MLDSQLLERFVESQDAWAFRDLVDRHGPAVLRTCQRLIHDPHEAEDAMQATFLILMQRAPSLQHPDQVDRWLAGVARRVATRARRRLVRRAERERTWTAQRAEGQSQAELLAEAELRHLVREELGQMPEADRRPLTLCYLEGLSHEEAADRLGCPVGTIKARLVRARRRLRDRLDRRGIALSLGLLLLLFRHLPRAAAAEGLGLGGQVLPWDWADPSVSQSTSQRALRSWFSGHRPATALRWVSRGWLVGAAVVLLAVGGVVGLGVVRARLDDARARQVSAQLLGVLNVDCRVGP